MVVYAGAVMVLYVFVVAYIGGVGRAAAPPTTRSRRTLGPLFAVALGVELCIAFIASGLQALDTRGAGRRAPASARPPAIGELLLTKFLLPFEAASFLLLVAAVGAVVLARKRRGLEDEGTGESARIPARRSPRTGGAA